MKRKKIVWWIVGIVCVGLFVINSAKNSVVEHVIESQLKKASGMDVHIDGVDIGLIGANICLQGVTIANTDEFGGRDFVTIPLLYIDSDVRSLFGKEKKIDEIKLHIVDVCIVKNKAGELNLARLKSMAAKKEQDGAEPNGAELVGVDIGQFVLTFDHVTFCNFSTGDEPEEMIIPVRVSHQTFKNVRSMQTVGQAVVIAAVLEGTAEEGGMDRIFTLGDHLKVLGGPEMEQKLNEFKEKFNTQAKGSIM